MSELSEWFREHYPHDYGCPRCVTRSWFPDGRCMICGMDPREHGPAPRRLLRGICI